MPTQLITVFAALVALSFAPGCDTTSEDNPTGGALGPCDSCIPTEHCVLCNSAGPPYGRCEPKATPIEKEFACKWLACTVGEVCVSSEPVGDGCPDAKCVSVPDSCSTDPACQCIGPALGAQNCSADDDGNITVKVSGYFL